MGFGSWKALRLMILGSNMAESGSNNLSGKKDLGILM